MAYCIYLRKSRADLEAEAHGEGETLSRHEHTLLELAKRGHYNVTQIYREIVSGDTIAARPVVQQLLQEVEDGLWEGVLVMEVERLARGDTIDQGIISQAFKYSNTKIITPQKVYDPSNEFDEEYFEFGLFMSRREYKTINRRLVSGRVAAVKEGKWVAAVAPYGYERVRLENDKGWTLRPVESEAEIVRLIFHLYVDGDTQPDGSIRHPGGRLIALRLDSMGIPTPNGVEQWSEKTILHILENPAYIGKVRWNVNKTRKKMVDGIVKTERYKSSADDIILADGLHPAIVDPVLFEQAQALLAASGPRPVNVRSDLSYPLSGLLICGKCGHRMYYQRDSKGSRIYCHNRSCTNHGALYDVVESRLLSALADWLSSYELSFSADPVSSEKADYEIRRKSLQRARSDLSRLNDQLGRAYDLLEQGVYDVDTFLSRSRDLADRISAAESKISSLSAEVEKDEERMAARESIIPRVENLLAVYPSLPTAQAKNDMLREVLEKVVYSKDRRGARFAPADDFELTIYPKLPPSSSA